MGNSLLDVVVFGRIAGCVAAEFIRGAVPPSRPTLDHVRRFHRELDAAGVAVDGRVSPMILPDYSNPEVRKKQLTTTYHGTLR
jgi:succinate dehydrogenase/fumarate reductase flavoprotein subunit